MQLKHVFIIVGSNFYDFAKKIKLRKTGRKRDKARKEVGETVGTS
jgi:hypothetical protein